MRSLIAGFTLLVMFLPLSVNGQEYQKAKQILDCVVKINTPLKDFPDPQADSVEALETNQILQILGKQGNWLDVQTQQSRGWISTFYVDVIGVSKNQKIKVIKKPRSKLRKTMNETDEEFFRNLRLVPYGSYALGGKNFYDQLRLGVYGTYKTSDYFSVGVLVEGVFFRGTYVAAGPTFHRLIPTTLKWLNPSVQASFLYYNFDHSGDSEKAFGVQWVLENDLPLIQKPSFILKPVIRTGFDLMLYSADALRIPYFFSLGAAVQF